MSESFALMKLSVLHHRRLLLVLLVTLAIGQAIAATLFVMSGMVHWPGVDLLATGVFCSFFVLLPAAFAGALAFDFSHGSDMNSIESGCSHWLLRAPLATWKIALVPAVLKTVWISAIWLIVGLVMRIGGVVSIPTFAPCFMLSAGVISLSALTWVPLQKSWYRLGGLGLLLILLYALAALVFGAAYAENEAWRAPLGWMGLLASIACHAGAVAGLFSACRRARIQPHGVIPEGVNALTQMKERHSELAARVRFFSSPQLALLWHEFAKRRATLVGVMCWGAMPIVLLFGLFVSVSPVSLFLLFLVFAYVAGFSVVVKRPRIDGGSASTLPIYVLASPFTSARLAWTSLIVSLVMVGVVFSCVLVVYLLWSLWPSNRHEWLQWSAQQAAYVGDPLRTQGVMIEGGDSIGAGVRITLAITFAAGLFFVSRIAAFQWVPLAGRTWFELLVVLVSLALTMAPFSYFLHWFMLQRDWDHVRQSFYESLTWLPSIVILCIVLKLFASLVCSYTLWHKKLVSLPNIVLVHGLWWSLVILAASLVTALLPYPQATWVTCAGATIVVVPLVRILAMPLTLAWNRHR